MTEPANISENKAVAVTADPVERLRRLQERAVESGVRFVSEAELDRNWRERQARIAQRRKAKVQSPMANGQSSRSSCRSESSPMVGGPASAFERGCPPDPELGEPIAKEVQGPRSEVQGGEAAGAALPSSIVHPPSSEVLVARNFVQRDFVASGSADSADERLWSFFFEKDARGDWRVKVCNFNKWFKSSLLEDFIATSRRMNNRAVTFRERSRPLGLELDNQMIRPHPNMPVSSHYRLCPIEDALHLSQEQKQEILDSLPR